MTNHRHRSFTTIMGAAFIRSWTSMMSSRAGGHRSTRRRLRALALLMGLYLLVIGFLLGSINERILFDRRRDAVLKPYQDALTAWHATLTTRPAEDPGPGDASTVRAS